MQQASPLKGETTNYTDLHPPYKPHLNFAATPPPQTPTYCHPSVSSSSATAIFTFCHPKALPSLSIDAKIRPMPIYFYVALVALVVLLVVYAMLKKKGKA